MSRAICGLCGADWPDEGGPQCTCRDAADRVVATQSSSALMRFGIALNLFKGISPHLAADIATGRAKIGEA